MRLFLLIWIEFYFWAFEWCFNWVFVMWVGCYIVVEFSGFWVIFGHLVMENPRVFWIGHEMLLSWNRLGLQAWSQCSNPHLVRYHIWIAWFWICYLTRYGFESQICTEFRLEIYGYLCVTSWCSGRLIGSPRQRSRVQDPISTINIHEGSHWFFRTLHVVGFSLR